MRFFRSYWGAMVSFVVAVAWLIMTAVSLDSDEYARALIRFTIFAIWARIVYLTSKLGRLHDGKSWCFWD